MSLQVCIMTPDQIFWDDQAEQVILPTNTGQMGVLANHASLMTALDIGVMLIKTKKDWIPLALMGGFALVQHNQITVLVNDAESSETIDAEQAEKDFNEAKIQLAEAKGEKQKVEADFVFKRARARYQVVKKFNN